MTKPARNPEAVEAIRDGIIDKAVDVLSAEGFDRLTMRRIASFTGMSATNLYNYFANKDEIYISVLIKGFEKLFRAFQAIVGSGPEPREKARRLMNAYLEFGIENSHYYDIMFTRPVPKYNDYVGTSLEEMAGIEMDFSEKIIEISMNMVRDMMSLKKLKFSDEDLVLRLLQIWAMLHGLIVLNNSRIVSYVAKDHHRLYTRAIDDILDSI